MSQADENDENVEDEAFEAVDLERALVLDSYQIAVRTGTTTPMQFVDRVIALTPGRYAVGTKRVSAHDRATSRPRHAGDFPATLGFQSLAQLAAIAADPNFGDPEIDEPVRLVREDLRPDFEGGGKRPLDANVLPRFEVLSIESLRVDQEAVPGDTLTLTVSILGECEVEEWPRRAALAVEGHAETCGRPYLGARFTVSRFEAPPLWRNRGLESRLDSARE